MLNAFQQTDAQRCDAELSSAERRAIIDRVERFSPQELRQCEKWVHRSRSSYLHALKIKRAGGAYATEQLAEAKRCSGSLVKRRITIPGRSWGIAGFSKEDLPLAIQFAGRHGEEETLFKLAHAFETEAGHYRKLPPFS